MSARFLAKLNSINLVPTFWSYLAPLLALAVAFGLRLYRIDDASLWLDEILTIRLSELPLSTLWVTPYDPTPPLFYTLEKLALLVGDTEFLIRLPSAIYGSLTVLVLFKGMGPCSFYLGSKTS